MAIGFTHGISKDDELELIASTYFVKITRTTTKEITITTPSDGPITCYSNNSRIVSTEIINGNVIKISTRIYGSAVLTIAQDYGTGIYSNIIPKNISILVIVQPASLGATLNDASWSDISDVASQGAGELYWAIGDTKQIILNGNIGNNLTLSNFTTNVFIMHFNYPKNVFRQYPDNNIIFGGFKSSVNTPIALVDTKYNTWYSNGTICFNMNH